jgi:hypothetical protein
VARRVLDPRGGEWVIRRRWIERRRPLYGLGIWEREEGPLHAYGVGPWQLLAMFLLVPLVIVSAARRLLELVAAALAHARGRPWTVEARLDAVKHERLTWRVRGWGESKRAVAEAAAALSLGHELTTFGEPERG